MLHASTHNERRSSDKLVVIGRCLQHAFRPEASQIFDTLLAAIDASDGARIRKACDGDALPIVGPALEQLRALARGEVNSTTQIAETGPTLIWRDQMMPLMLAACPSFQAHWKACYGLGVSKKCNVDQDVPDALPLYLSVDDLSRHIACKLDFNETSEFAAVFAIVERWIVEGSETVKAVAITGFLEDLLRPHIYALSGPKDLLLWVGPRTYKWWVEVGGFWDRLASGRVTDVGD